MPNGPLFSNQPADSTVESCPPRQAKKGGAKKWDVPCILKILCKNDKKIVEQLAKTTVNTADEIYFEDNYFDGKAWTIKKFPAGGSANPAAKEITILTKASCEGAADTFYHEIWHQNQPAGMGWPEPSEDDAYYNTELWLIERGLPGNPDLRTKDAKTGKVVPDKKAIRELVQKEYPGPPPPVKGVPQPRPIDSDKAKNLTKVEDPVTRKTSWRPSKKGDIYDGPEKRINPKTIKKSDWKCP
jgi:hypothetical protein